MFTTLSSFDETIGILLGSINLTPTQAPTDWEISRKEGMYDEEFVWTVNHLVEAVGRGVNCAGSCNRLFAHWSALAPLQLRPRFWGHYLQLD